MAEIKEFDPRDPEAGSYFYDPYCKRCDVWATPPCEVCGSEDMIFAREIPVTIHVLWSDRDIYDPKI